MTTPAKLTASRIYRAHHVARLLGISRATLYRIAWLQSRKVHLTDHAVGWYESDVALYQAMRTGLRGRQR